MIFKKLVRPRTPSGVPPTTTDVIEGLALAAVSDPGTTTGVASAINDRTTEQSSQVPIRGDASHDAGHDARSR